jgi:hypothetical protein
LKWLPDGYRTPRKLLATNSGRILHAPGQDFALHVGVVDGGKRLAMNDPILLP